MIKEEDLEEYGLADARILEAGGLEGILGMGLTGVDWVIGVDARDRALCLGLKGDLGVNTEALRRRGGLEFTTGVDPTDLPWAEPS